MEPTIVVESRADESVPPGVSADVSRAKVGFVEGSRPRFSDETAKLLRKRLSAAALALSLILFAAFIELLHSGVYELWWFRGIVLALIFGGWFVLHSDSHLSLSQLRVIELLVFGSVAIQVAAMLSVRITGFAELGDATSMAAIKHLFLGAWCVLLFVYGIFMPNTWKRAAAVMLPLSLIPHAVLLFHSARSQQFSDLMALDHAAAPLPLPLISALVGVYGAHVINSARREAFKARQFGQYRLLEKLGSGGMGEVYKAEHVLLKRPCAMKLIKPSDEADANAIDRFETEVKATAKLTHWNTVEIYDYGHTDDGTFYYVMELLPGMSLEEIVKDFGPIPPARAVHFLRQLCGALQEAHTAGLIHRDIKPANIFAAQRGGIFDVAKLLDFGLVKEKQTAGGEGEQGAFSGTPLYMSPEQASAYDQVDGRADIYSLGGVAYFLVTGRPPFTGESVVNLLMAHARSEASPPSEINPDVHTDLDQIILRCLSKKPDDRYPDATSLADALSKCQCAGEWTDVDAAKWWAQRQSKRPAAAANIEKTIAVTSTMTATAAQTQATTDFHERNND